MWFFLTNKDAIEEAKQCIRGCLRHPSGNIRDPSRSVRYNYISENDSLTVIIAIEKLDVDERVHEIILKPSTTWKQVFDFCNTIFFTGKDLPLPRQRRHDDDWSWPYYFL